MLKSSLIPVLLLSTIISGCSDVSETVVSNGEKISEGDTNNPDIDRADKVPNLTSTAVREYYDQWLIDIDNSSLSGTDYTHSKVGETLTQSFILRSADPIEQTVSLSYLYFKQYFWTGADSEIKFSIIDGQTQEVLIVQDFHTGPIGGKSGVISASGNALTLETPLDLQINKSYVMQFQVNKAQSDFSLYKTTTDYTDGESNGEGDIWFKALAGARWLEYDAISLVNDDTNTLVYDPGYATPLKAKMLSLDENDAGIERLLVNKNSSELALRYELSNTDMVNIQVTKDSSTDQDEISLQGVQLGTSYLNVYHNEQLIERVELQVTKPYNLKMSLSYIAYPGEVQNNVMDSFEYIKSDFDALYGPLNIHMDWHDNGIIEFEWDLNDDGMIWTDARDELHSPRTHNILPNMEDYFNNLYIVRLNKDDDYFGGCGGGGSSFNSEGNTAPRTGFIQVHTKSTPACLTPTLMHETAHNLGIGHYSSQSVEALPADNELSNVMKVGMQESKLFAFQWKIAHQTLTTLAEEGKL